ncbi:unnamed protein product [Prunus armeniaca]
MVGFRPVFKLKFGPLPAIFQGDCYRFGHPCAAGPCGGAWGTVALGIGSQSIPSLSRGRRCPRIGIWLPFESRTDFAYCAISGFDMFGPLDQAQTHMSDLIRRRRAVTTTPSSEPPARPVSAATAPALPVSARRQHWPASTTDTTSTDAKRNTRGPCRQLKTAKVTWVTNSRISIGYDEHHRAAPTAELHSSLAHDIGHVVRTHCPMQWKSWKVMPDEIKMETNYHLEDLNEESMAYVNRLFGERYKQWKSDLHHHFEAFDDLQVALQEGCPKELEGREDSWALLCAHFQAPDYVNKTQVNKGNRKKKTLFHHSGSRPFSYRMDARRWGGSKFPEIDVFGDVYVRLGNELAESLHTTIVERSQLVLQESASQLPPETPIESVDPPQDAGFQILTQTLDQTLGRRPGTYCRGMGNARQKEPRPRSSSQANNQVTVLTSRVAELKGQMSVILQSLERSGIPIPNFGAPTSEPVHPEHPQQTTAPVNAQTFEPHVADDQIIPQPRGGATEAQGGGGAPPLAGKCVGDAGICPFACALQVFD